MDPNYSVLSLRFQTHSPGSGGAIYASLAVPSPLNRDGLVSIRDTTFIGNWAPVRGGTIYVSADVSTEVKATTIENSKSANNTATVRPIIIMRLVVLAYRLFCCSSSGFACVGVRLVY